MRALRVFLCAIAALSFPFLSGIQAQRPATAQSFSSEGSAVPQAPAAPDGCKAYFSIEPIDQGVMKLLSTPAVPRIPSMFTTTSAKHIADNPNREIQYSQYAGSPQKENIGANTASVSPNGHNSTYDEFTGKGASEDPSAHACIYLYRTNGTPLGQGGTRQATPDYYYCHEASAELWSSAVTMLKYLSKTSPQ